MIANTTLYDAEYPSVLDVAFPTAPPSPHRVYLLPRASISELLKVLALYGTIAAALDPHVLWSPYATPIHTATTTTDTSPASRQRTEELLEVSIPRLPLSVQRASVSFVVRTHTVPRLVGGTDLVAG